MNDFAASDRPGRAAVVHYRDDANAFRGIAIRGALLEFVTFGFYRFWLTTEIRRHLWGHTSVDGDGLEYTGRGKELFLGFLIALAVLTPLFLVSGMLGLVGGSAGAAIRPLISAFYYLFWQFAIYRGRRYRLTRTVWRGVRFWMTGSGWAYAMRSALWGVVAVLTLGFAYPWRMAALERYKLGHTLYGTLQGGFVASGWDLFKRVWWIWLFGLIAAGFIFVGPVAGAVLSAAGVAAGNRWLAGLFVPLSVISLLLLFGLPFLHAWRMAAEWRWWAEGIRFGGLAVACELPRTGLVSLYWGLIGVVALILAVFGVIGAAGAAMLRLGHATDMLTLGHTSFSVLTVVLIAVWYLGLFLTLGVAWRIFLAEKVWRRVVNTCWLRNNHALAEVTAAGVPVSAVGEGLADGLDFAGF